jgi:hypothetical protein
VVFRFFSTLAGTEPKPGNFLFQRLQHPLIVSHSKLVVFAPISLLFCLFLDFLLTLPSPIMILAKVGYILLGSM